MASAEQPPTHDDPHRDFGGIFSVVRSLPDDGPFEPPDLALVVGGSLPLESRVIAPSAPGPSSLRVHWMPRVVLPGRPLVFELSPVHEFQYATALEEEALIRFLAGHLRVTVSVDGICVMRCLSTCTGFRKEGRFVVRVVVTPFWLASAHEISLVALSIASVSLVVQGLPVRVKIGAFTHPAPAGRLWEASKAGDCSAVYAAIADGCSVEETASDAVSSKL